MSQQVTYHVLVAPALNPLFTIALLLAFAVGIVVTLRSAAFGAALIALATPFDFAHAVMGTTVSIPKAVLIGVAIGLIPRILAHARFWSSAYRWTGAGFAAILIGIGLSAFGANHYSQVVHELLKWIEYTAYFTVFYAAMRLSDDARPIAWGITMTIALVCVSALAEEIFGAHSGLWIGGRAFPRVAGVLEGPNQLGAYCEIACAFFGAWSIGPGSRTMRMLLAVTTFTLFLTFSRGSIFGLAVVLVVLAVVQKRNAIAPVLAAAVGGAASFLLVGGLLAMDRLGAASGYANLIFRAPNATEAGGVGTRNQLWGAAIFFFKTHPLFGIGAGNFEYRLPEAGVLGVQTHANSWYLQSLAEGGLSLFAATLFFIGALLASLRRALAVSPWALAAFAATCALALHQVVDDVVFYPKVATLWCMLIGIGIAAATDVTCDSQPSH